MKVPTILKDDIGSISSALLSPPRKKTASYLSTKDPSVSSLPSDQFAKYILAVTKSLHGKLCSWAKHLQLLKSISIAPGEK